MSVDNAPASGQSLSFAGARIFGLVISTATSLVLIRVMTVDEFGAFAAATGVFLLISSLGYLGVDQLLLSRQVSSGMFVLLTPRLGGLTLALTLVLAAAWPGLTWDERAVLVVLGVTRALDLQRGPWTLLPQLTGLHVRRALRELVGQVAVCTGLVVAVLLRPEALAVAVGGLLGSVLVTGVVLLFFRPPAVPGERESGSWLGRVIGGVGFAASSIIFSAINAMGLALMPILASRADVAVFRATLLIYTAALVLPVAVNNDVLRPHLYLASEASGAGPVARPPLRGRTLNLNLGLAAVAVVGVLVVGGWGAALLFGPGYDEVSRLVVPAAASLPFAFLSSYVANVLVAHGRLRAVVWCQVGLLLLAVVVNAVLIAHYGALGGAMSLLVVDSAALVAYLVLWHSLSRKPGDPSWA